MFRERIKLFFFLFSIISASFFLVALFFHPSVRPSLPLWMAVALINSLLCFLFVYGRFLQPLQHLSSKVARVPQDSIMFTEGNLRQDELGILARRLNEMSESFRRLVVAAIGEKEEVRAVITSMSEGVLVVGADKKILHASHPVIKMLDLRTGNPYGRFFWEALRYEEVVVLIEEALKSPVAINRDLIIPTEGAAFSVHASPVFGAEQQLHSVVVIFHDISSLRKYDRMRSDFVANVSHELKTPLTSIKGFVETLKAGAIDDREVALRFLNIIDSQAQRLEKLVADILFLSAVEAQEMTGELPHKEPLSISVLLADVLEAQKVQIDEKSHQSSLTIAPGVKNVMGDRGQLEQVFINLVSNAIKFTPPSGSITIAAYENDTMVRVDVKDTGVGIPPEHLGRLFERFYRVDKARSQEMGGTGLGLAIVKHIVALHGGKVTVSSIPFKGATFSVFLPVAS